VDTDNAENRTKSKKSFEARKAQTAAATATRLNNAAHRGARDPVVLRRSLRVVRAWAEQQAASLPPLTDAQVAVAARLAAELDAKRARQDGAA
jgi:hypothetical protein